ncbi:DUF1793-domain-containing protein [Cylindrobasidium torrendii FP15055 ss-10]|uniref:DUF1793-domain-containing protein n=1 Tax=Cylindrobasidium torrendii FP15055 ss-10 TaxID=1314674 RepID=A0A0D7BV81_9AGAR|nr:DUF1793-domain-containing protein [Cylindrobasidium torrendii FP15055 ss-10]
MLSFLPSLVCFAAAANALDWTATPFNPPAIPLVVRTPYVSAWLPQGPGVALNDAWPTFWTGSILGWAGFAKVDGTSYSFLGAANVDGQSFEKAVQTSFEFTSTQSTFVLTAGPVDLEVSFLSPVEPNDLVKYSTPFGYMSVKATANDGASHSVQIYSDISAEWVSGDLGLSANWSTTTTGSNVIHQVSLLSPSQYAEVNDHTQYGSAYWATSNTAGTTYQSGSDTAVRAQFLANGNLANSQDTNFRAINDNWPVFGLATDLGTTSSASVVFTVGHVRDPAISYIVDGGALEDRSFHFWSAFSSVGDLIDDFLADYNDALTRAEAFDAQVDSDAKAISNDYAGVVALSIRQALGATELTISKNGDGSWNTDDVLLFMKEISSDGNTNTVDVIFPAWPVLLYTNPTLGKYLLDVLFQYQATGQYPNRYSVHDIGAHYPNAVGHNDGLDEAMPVEESGNMIIMALSYAQRTGDNSQLTTYADLLDQWTQYLIEDSLIPEDQLSTDDFAGHLANQTNLAIKGIIGIQAMSEIASIVGDSDKSANYSSIASSYVEQWLELSGANGGEHLNLHYGDPSSWGLAYNLYAEKLLDISIFPTSVYEMQTAWYKTVIDPYGIPLDTRHTYTKSDWEIWTSVIVTDTTLRDDIISGVRAWAADGLSTQPFGDWYETADGSPQGFRARPVVGGHLAHLVI